MTEFNDHQKAAIEAVREAVKALNRALRDAAEAGLMAEVGTIKEATVGRLADREFVHVILTDANSVTV